MTTKMMGESGTGPMTGRSACFHTMRPARRSLLWIALLVPLLVACVRGGNSFAGDRKLPVGTLYLDARDNKCGVKIYNENGQEIGGGSLLNLGNAKMYSFPGGERGLPASIRATWTTCQRTPSGAYTGIGGTPAGDFTVPVAERIPAEVIEHLRTRGGSLRLKIRLVDAGVLIGWDIETRIQGQADGSGRVPTALRHVLAGGDFCERQVYAGKVVEPGWEHPPKSMDNMAGRNPSQ
jgi:hypothetical protein